MMFVLERKSGELCAVEFSKFDYLNQDLLVEDDFIFDWNEEASFEVYISLRPKTILTKHYIQKYKMKITGQVLSIEVPELIDLINEYE